MPDTPDENDAEIAALATIGATLAKIADPEARSRVLSYFVARYNIDPRAAQVIIPPLAGAPMAASAVPVVAMTQKELPGVARLTDTGDLKITARDLKAKSGLDAANRLAHIAIYAHERLTGQPLSSRKGLTPLLKEWRLYDGNVRARLSKERGIIRSDDSLSLDTHARRDAERFVEEVLNEEVVGQWKPK